MKERHEEAAIALGRLALAGVGEREESHSYGASTGVHVIHVRRPVTVTEDARLPETFRSCEAIDLAGGRPIVRRGRRI